jgi:catalase
LRPAHHAPVHTRRRPFSNSTGIPLIPDTDPNASPRGFAIRFQLAEHVHTDIIGHSTDGFPTHTGDEFLEFLRALATSDPANLKGSPLEAFLGSHPAALAFVQAPKPAPSSFARESYFGVTAMRFINQQGKSRYGRFRILPAAGNDFLDDAAAKAKSPNYLFDELPQRLAKGPIAFRIVVQLAEDGDTVDDATIHWPEPRTLADFGSFTLNAVVPDNAAQQKQIIFDPIPRVDGIEPSDDPLLELRAAIYLISGRRRRSA